jgi:hypothetical protein
MEMLLKNLTSSPQTVPKARPTYVICADA